MDQWMEESMIKTDWNVSYETITPDRANEILARHNYNNRKIRQKTFQKYTRIMEEGGWVLTPEPIVISKTGRLLNGQHRLKAVVRSNTPVDFMVIDNVDDKVFSALDRGAVRSTADALVLDKKLVETAGVISKAVHGIHMHDGAIGKIASDISDAHTSLLANCGTATKIFSSAPFRAAACIRVIEGRHPRYAKETYKSLVNGDVSLLAPQPLSFLAAVARGAVRPIPGGHHQLEMFLKAWDVFDFDKKDNSKIIIKNVVHRIEEIRGKLKRVLPSQREVQHETAKHPRRVNCAEWPEVRHER
jgi:hypothetical protein